MRLRTVQRMFTTLPALSLISAMIGTALLIAGMITFIKKPSRPSFLKIGAVFLILGIMGLWIVSQAAAAV